MKEYELHLHESGILEWKINRPEKRNAINYAVMDGLEKALEEAESNPLVKILLVKGAGDRAFCSGGDLKAFHQLKTEDQAYEMLERMGKLLYRLATLEKPTVALINGVAVGGGCELATACDFRIAKAGSKMGFVQGKLAITTGWGGGSLLFERLAPHDALKILSEAKVYDVETLMEKGYIHQIIPNLSMDHVHSHLHDLLDTPVQVLTAYKKLLIQKWQQQQLEQRMAKEIRQCAVLWEKDEHHEAVEAFLAK